MSDYQLEAAHLRSRRSRKWGEHGPEVLAAWIADMDFEPAAEIQAAIERLAADRDYGYPLRNGLLPERALANAFSHRQQELYGWEPDPELVWPLSDLVQAMQATIIAFSEPSDRVLLQMPAYPPFLKSIDVTGRTLLGHPLVVEGQRWRIDLTALEELANKVGLLMVCNPHNPTGRVFERTELEALGRIAIERDLVIVSDEVHSDITYPGHRHVPMAKISPEVADRTVTITSATKSFNIAGLRCALIHFGSGQLRERFSRRIPERLLGQLNSFGLDATTAAWESGASWLAKTMGKLLYNRNLVTGFVRDHLPAAGFSEPEATYFAWLDLSAFALRPSPQDVLLTKARVATSAGGDFGPAYHEFVRLNFATSTAILEEILARIASTCHGARHNPQAQRAKATT